MTADRFSIEYIEEFADKACTNAHHCAMLRQLLAEVRTERARREGTEQAILTVAADRDEAIQRAEDAETQCSSMVSARDLTIRDLREKLAAAEGALRTLRDGLRDYSARGMGESLPVDFEMPPSTNKRVRALIDAVVPETT